MAFLGEESQWAAEASECAADQDAFWAYHDKLFASQNGENQGAFTKDKLKGFAADLRLDTSAFNACLDAGKTTLAVQADTAAAQALGAQSTPSFFVNDWLALGALPIEEFDAYIAKAQQGIHPPPTPTPLPQGVQFYDVDPSRPGLTYDGSPTQGEATAPLLMLAFEDLKSEESAQYVKSIEPALQDKYIAMGQLRVVLKLFPIVAPKAAAVALCAVPQGKFWELRAALYDRQADWEDSDEAAFIEIAKSAGLDEAQLKACLADAQTQTQVDELITFGQQIGVPQVPAFLIIDLQQNGVVGDIVGAATLADFTAKLEAALHPPTPAAPAATPTPAQ